MENNIKVSIVIPVYNTEQYVRTAVESITDQTLKELEILIINDGSVDKSIDILEELATLDNRIQIYSQINQGQSVARNTGITYAKGEYIYFMDSDDFLEKDTLELCYQKCEKEQLDFVFFDADIFFDDNIQRAPILSYKRTMKLDSRVYIGSKAFKIQLDHKVFTPSPCLSFIRKSFLEKHNLQFYPGILHEDQLFTALLYLYSEKTACIQRSFFHRRMRENSIMTSKFSSRNLHGYLIVTREILKFKKHHASIPNIDTILDLYLSQMLNAVVWESYVLSLKTRLKLAYLCLFKYKCYVSTRNIGVLLFKSLTTAFNEQKKIEDKT